MDIRYLCRFFRGYIPCRYHKEQGATCDDCGFFSPKAKKILIIKLLARGDVLRTTFILEPLRDKFKNCHITWLTHQDAKLLLINNDLIDEVIEYDLDTVTRLLVERYDIVFNPGNDRASAILATLANAKRKFGFVYNKAGYIEPLGKMARYYLEMGSNDDLKKQNKLTYQQIVSGIMGIKDYGSKPVIRLNREELLFADNFKYKNGLENHFVIGLNTGAGKRWQLKKLSVERTIELARLINKQIGAKIILFGGVEEVERNREITNACRDFLIHTGCNNSLREYSALINLVDVLITSDTLAAHIAVALDKHVVCLFGPTSFYEVELYDNGVKIYSRDMRCLTCYRNTCLIKPSCMDRIDLEEIKSAVIDFANNHVQRQR